MITILNYILLLSKKNTFLSSASIANLIFESVNEIVKKKTLSENGKIHVDYFKVKNIVDNALKKTYPNMESFAVGMETINREKLWEFTHDAIISLNKRI